MKRILLINTGGTISSSPTCNGLVPAFSSDSLLEQVPEVKRMCAAQAMSLMSVDSTNMQPEHWAALARAVCAGLEQYDGIVVAHGTDTMAYTAAALSFMLGSLAKPVVLTGSQQPIGRVDGDSRRNLLDAFAAACGDVAGVLVAFHGKVMKGCRVTKVRSKSFDAFESVNYPDLGYIRDGQLVRNPAAPYGNLKPLPYSDRLATEVFLLKLLPGIKPDILEAVRQLGYKGVVIEGFGLGGVPNREQGLVAGIERLTEAGICVAVTTQCLYEGSDLTVYEVGRTALAAGAIPGYDMTTEALTVKLMWALGQSSDIGTVKGIMGTNVAYEMTV
ncbi:L-asparaginase [Paenibacillus sp. UNCCL117]|uniref:asparaginase n=1 Tax=unclassified Paenibacillus TaxID=185978 RepID=UPI000889859B|nr:MULTISPECIES: asparaginase [unclassified Paenibacillus]SDD32377.1 L-asparaginase [Paenibacillus sp. cl123]SFW39848.1 L-asparaginase [Paenibacillus sp. UNCCL117]